jgi:NitT/TauT family transport system permease protein
MFGLNPWYRFKTLMLPFGAIGLIWNSVISWSNGWFFLMAAEAFQVNQKDFRLPGIGAYLKVAADKGNTSAIISGVIVLIIMIVALDQLIWRPLVAWSERFRLDMVNADESSSSWFLDVLNNSSLVRSMKRKVFRPVTDKIDYFMSRYLPTGFHEARVLWVRVALRWLCYIALIAIMFYAFGMGALLLGTISLWQWGQLSLMVVATFLRVIVSLALCLIWTVPIGVAIGMNPKIARWAQPFAQVAAAIPATALFPLFVLFLLRLSGTLEIPAILLMMSGIQWYLLFNIIAGASAIPQDLRYTASLMHMKGKGKWRDFILPSLFPYLVTGSVTAFTGAWNACIVAEYIVFQGKELSVFGVGSRMSEATDQGNYAMLLASTLTLVVVVVLVNRFVWRRLFQIAEDRYRME